jgi:hypothetical protein
MYHYFMLYKNLDLKPVKRIMSRDRGNSYYHCGILDAMNILGR